MNQDPPEVVDLHPSEWKRGNERWRFFGSGAIPFLVYGVTGIVIVTVVRWIVGLL